MYDRGLLHGNSIHGLRRFSYELPSPAVDGRLLPGVQLDITYLIVLTTCFSFAGRIYM